MNKEKKLKDIARIIETCSACKEGSLGIAVPGEGNPDAKIMFVGEAPGKQEAKTGKPFIGRSGQLLRKKIREVGLKEKDVYITSPVKYLPTRGTPTRAKIIHSREHFNHQVKIIDPKILVLLGKSAIYAVLGEDISIMKHHGELRSMNGRLVFLTIHPAAAIRFSKFKKVVDEDFNTLKKLINKTFQ